jgi:hypothetical protein
MSIFISIVGYRDTELPKTIKSLYDNADKPKELVFGIVSQDLKACHPNVGWLGDQAKLYKMHARDAKGAGYARKIAMELYDGEDYFFQTDSHMRFIQGWDTKLKDMLLESQKLSNNKQVILSQFPAPYTIHSDGKDYYEKGDPDFWDDVSWTSVVNTWAAVWAGKREVMKDKTKPMKSHTILAGLLFTIGDFVKEIPYDERICFMGEELCIAIRSYTRGWEIYAPNEMVCWHFYKRKDRPKVWNDNTYGRSWTDLEMKSQKVQRDVILGVEQGVYGIGDYNKYVEYQEMININFADFYKNSIDRKVNLGLLTQEINFDKNFNMIEISITGYCNSGLHEECFAKDNCQCVCHEGEKNV